MAIASITLSTPQVNGFRQALTITNIHEASPRRLDLCANESGHAVMKTTTSERSLPRLIELYLLRCRVEGKSERTVIAYGESLRRFLRAALCVWRPSAFCTVTGV